MQSALNFKPATYVITSFHVIFSFSNTSYKVHVGDLQCSASLRALKRMALPPRWPPLRSAAWTRVMVLSVMVRGFDILHNLYTLLVRN